MHLAVELKVAGGVLYTGTPAAEALVALGLTPETARQLLAAEFAEIQARRNAS